MFEQKKTKQIEQISLWLSRKLAELRTAQFQPIFIPFNMNFVEAV